MHESEQNIENRVFGQNCNLPQSKSSGWNTVELTIGMPAELPHFTICSCIAHLQNQVLVSLGLARAIAGASSSSAQTQRSKEARGGWVAQPGDGLSPKVRTASGTARSGNAVRSLRKETPLQRVNSVTVDSSKRPVSAHTADERLTPSPGKGVTPQAPALHTPPVRGAREPGVKKPEQRSRSRKTVTVGKETKELMKKIFVEEHLTERDLFWREKGDTWVNSKYTCYVDY